MVMMLGESLTYAPLGLITTLEQDRMDVLPEALHYFFQGITSFQHRNHQEALEAFEKALQYKEDFAEAWYDKALALGHLEVWPESQWPGFTLRQADVLQSYIAL